MPNLTALYFVLQWDGTVGRWTYTLKEVDDSDTPEWDTESDDMDSESGERKIHCQKKKKRKQGRGCGTRGTRRSMVFMD